MPKIGVQHYSYETMAIYDSCRSFLENSQQDYDYSGQIESLARITEQQTEVLGRLLDRLASKQLLTAEEIVLIVKGWTADNGNYEFLGASSCD